MKILTVNKSKIITGTKHTYQVSEANQAQNK